MSDDKPTIEPGTILAGRYRVERRLGEGGMGSVFLVQHVHTEQHLALKVLRSAIVKDAVALERFRREARAPAKIQSDHVVQVIDADVAPELGSVPFLVMEWLRGENLEQASARGPMPPATVVLYLRQTARALDKAHALGIVHRDLKPENLFLTTREDGAPWVKLLDFGIAKLSGGPSELSRVASATSTGQIFGTPMYMSPEQAKGDVKNVSPRSDIWALGLIAQKLLTGREIWTAQSLTHLVAQIAYEPMPVPSEHGADFGPAYDAWFARACARDPSERFKTAGEAVSALASALSVHEAQAPSSQGEKSLPAHRAHSVGALAETALDTGSAPVAGTSVATLDAPREKPPRRSQTPIIVGALALIAVASLGIGLMLGRGTTTSATATPTSLAPATGSSIDIIPPPTSRPSVAPQAPPPPPAPDISSAPSTPPPAASPSMVASKQPIPKLSAPVPPAPPTPPSSSGAPAKPSPTFEDPLDSRF